MKCFEYINAESTVSAVQLLSGNGLSRPIAGGTDLLSELKLGIIESDRLVNLKTIRDLADIRFDERNGLQIGALATLNNIAGQDIVQRRYVPLFKAISFAASPQLRNMGTIGGNLCQDSRCWYYRGPFHCWLKGGEICDAKDGENAPHAIFGGGPCYTVHPSDPAPALIALGAEVRILGPEGERTFPVEQLFQRPHAGARRLIVLRPSEIIIGVKVPTPAPGSRGTYIKAANRKVWSFALASVALQLTFNGDIIGDARLVLGGVAPTPWRLPEAEAALRGKRLDDTTISHAADLTGSGAQPLSHNGYKISLVKGIVQEALESLKS